MSIKPILKPKRTKKTKRQKLILALDKAWSLKVREVRKCDLDGTMGQIGDFDAHHLKKRGNQSTRWDLNNGACLTKGNHRFKVHMDTFTVGILIDKLKEERGEDWWTNLCRRTEEIYKPSTKELEAKLKELETKASDLFY